MIRNKTVGLGILSWKSHDTLEKTLKSYEDGNLFSFFDQNLIYFNSLSEDDIKIAKKFGLEYNGSKENLGIFGGTEALAKSMRCKYILLLQNDCPLIGGGNIKKQLETSIALLETGKIDLMRLRHRFLMGEGFSDVKNYLRYYPLREIDENYTGESYSVTEKDFECGFAKTLRGLLRPFKKKRLIGRGVYVEKHPEQLFPKYVEKTEDGVFIVDSAVINHTDQSLLLKKDFLLDVLFGYCRKRFKNPLATNRRQTQEVILNCRWWRQQHYKIGVCEGLFSHQRFDRPPEDVLYCRDLTKRTP
jgi:hypothetical protein